MVDWKCNDRRLPTGSDSCPAPVWLGGGVAKVLGLAALLIGHPVEQHGCTGVRPARNCRVLWARRLPCIFKY